MGAEPGPEKCHAEFISASLSGSPLPARPNGVAGRAGLGFQNLYISILNPVSDLVVASRGATGDKFRVTI
ncbi:MAG: hypothetical protein ACE5GU_10955 [Candidatus Scalinduaceae bacterium]